METDFKLRIKELRIKSDMTQKEFAKKAEISVAAYSAYEQGTKMPPLEIAMKIAKAFNVSLDWLCGFWADSSVPKSIGEVIKMLIDMSRTTLYFGLDEEKLPPDQIPNFLKQYQGYAVAAEDGKYHIFQAVLKCADPRILSFFEDWASLYKLYRNKQIDENVYLLWANDQIKRYSKDALGLIERMGD